MRRARSNSALGTNLTTSPIGGSVYSREYASTTKRISCQARLIRHPLKCGSCVVFGHCGISASADSDGVEPARWADEQGGALDDAHFLGPGDSGALQHGEDGGYGVTQ